MELIRRLVVVHQKLIGRGMRSLLDLHLLLDKYAALPDLNLDGDEQEECSTMLLWLQNQVEGGIPNPRVVDECHKRLNLSNGSLLVGRSVLFLESKSQPGAE
jgi:hypothetical protein